MVDINPGATAYNDMVTRDLVAKLNEVREAGVKRELPQYQCHKRVWALKIAAVRKCTEDGEEDDGRRIIIPVEEGFAPFEVGSEYVNKHIPEVGGYYVVYEDGYRSYSPAQAFESGYTKIDAVRPPDQEERAGWP